MGIYGADQNAVGFFYESGTYGNTSGALQWIGLIQSHDIDENMNRTPIRYAGTATRNVDMFVDVQTDVTGNFTYYPQDFKFLMFALGSIVDAGSPSPYTHTISEINSNSIGPFTSGTRTPFISFGLEDSKTSTTAGLNFLRTVKGGCVDNFELTWSEGGIMEASVDYVAQSVTFSSGAATALTEDTSAPFVAANVKLHVPSGTIYPTTDGAFRIANNLNPRHYSNGSMVISVVRPENRDYGLDVTMDMESSEAKIMYDQYFKGGSAFNAMLEVTVSTGSRDAFITLSGCKILSMDIPSPVEGVQPYSLTVQPESASGFVNDLNIRYGAW